MDTTAHHTMDATISAAASKATYTGAGMTVGGWLLSSEFAVLVGMLAAVAGLAVNWYYSHRAYVFDTQVKREQANLEMQLMREQAERDRAEHEQRMGRIGL